MSLSNTVNSILKKMHEQDVPTNKGTYGEQAVFSICEDFYQHCGGILIHSYSYKVDKSLSGNIKIDDKGKGYVENLGSTTEIDILLVTPYKMFSIEVKAYKAKKITLTNTGISGCAFSNKSPVHQNEMHMRHLYPAIFSSLPDGMCYQYVVPIVVFTDETVIVDSRTGYQLEYILVRTLNNLKMTIDSYNKVYNNTLLDLPSIESKLRSVMVSSEKFLPYIK